MALPPFRRRREDKTPAKETADAAKMIATTLGIIVGVVGLFKTSVDLISAQHKDLRDRVAVETAFYEKRYEYAVEHFNGAQAEDQIKQALSLIYDRDEPDLSLGWLLDKIYDDKVRQARLQVCGARRLAESPYRQSAVFIRLERARERLLTEKPKAPEAQSYAFDRRCREARKEAVLPLPESVTVAQAAPTAPAPEVPAAVAKAAEQNTAAVAIGENAQLDCDTAPSAPYSKAGAKGGWDVDVFWCRRADGDADRLNFAAACRAYNRLAGAPSVGTPPQALGRLRLRPLDAAAQRKVGPPSGLESRYDAQSFDEQAFSDQLAQTAWGGAGYKLRASNSDTRWYVSLFSCIS